MRCIRVKFIIFIIYSIIAYKYNRKATFFSEKNLVNTLFHKINNIIILFIFKKGKLYLRAIFFKWKIIQNSRISLSWPRLGQYGQVKEFF